MNKFKSFVALVLVFVLTLTYPMSVNAYDDIYERNEISKTKIQNDLEISDEEVEPEIKSVPAIITAIILIIYQYGPQVIEFITRVVNNPILPIPIEEKVQIIKDNWDDFVDFMREQYNIIIN